MIAHPSSMKLPPPEGEGSVVEEALAPFIWLLDFLAKLNLWKLSALLARGTRGKSIQQPVFLKGSVIVIQLEALWHCFNLPRLCMISNERKGETVKERSHSCCWACRMKACILSWVLILFSTKTNPKLFTLSTGEHERFRGVCKKCQRANFAGWQVRGSVATAVLHSWWTVI